MNAPDRTLEARSFERDGYLVIRGLCPESLRAELERISTQHLAPVLGPVEYETDVGYPGSPASRAEQGGDTPRRLLNAYTRDQAFRRWSTGTEVADRLTSLFGCNELRLSQSHHNCVMTKHPGFSSATLWHQDIRYWSFDRPELISVWLAIGSEDAKNGALQVIPGSHRLELDLELSRGRFDRALFLRTDLAENRALIDQAVTVELAPGDTLFFHCRLFHAAGMNLTGAIKQSLVFTYHDADNHPIPETRSALLPSIAF